jgi:hypothetical protein
MSPRYEGKPSDDCVACDAVRAVVARLGVAEAQHDVAPARLECGVQAGDVGGAVGGIEDVEQAAVEHRVERLGEIGQSTGVVKQEPRGEVALVGLGLGGGQRGGSEVDTGRR